MMNPFTAYLSTEIERLKAEEAALASDNRRDEANLARIRRNIFEICNTVHGVFIQKSAPEAFYAAYIAKLDEFEAAWRKAQVLAGANADGAKAAIEEIKLEALASIRAKFIEAGEAAHD